jgi:hypothetical protein
MGAEGSLPSEARDLGLSRSLVAVLFWMTALRRFAIGKAASGRVPPGRAVLPTTT